MTTRLQLLIRDVIRANGAPMSADAIALKLRTPAHAITRSLRQHQDGVIVTVPGEGRTLYMVPDAQYWAEKDRAYQAARKAA